MWPNARVSSRAKGIKLESVMIEGGTDRMVAAIDDGKVDLAHSSTPYLISAVLKGSNAVGIAGEVGNPVYTLIVRPEIKSYADLKGKVIALSVAADTISITTASCWRSTACEDGEFKVKQLVGTPVRFACLKSGECAGVPLGQPNDIAAVKEGFRRLGDTTEAVGNFQFQLIVAHRAWAAANQDKVVPFVRAVADAFRFIRDPKNRAETIKLMMEQTGSSEEIARAVMALYFEPDRGVMPRQAEIDLKGLAQVIAFMGEAGDRGAAAAGRAVRGPAIPEGGGAAVAIAALFLRSLGRVPQCVHFGQGRLLGRFAARRQRALYRRKAAQEFLIGRAQRRFRIGIEMAGEIDHREQAGRRLRRRPRPACRP